MSLKIQAAAKINLFLDIVATLPNGYHSLFMVMQSVSLYDTVEIQATSTGKIELVLSDKNLPTGPTNTAYKAALAFYEATGLKNKGLKISIEKRIPHSAGLAGGSADAAAVLKGLNILHDTPLSEEELNKAALTVGSDVPFCLEGGTMLALDSGGLVTKLPAIPKCYLVLAKPFGGVSTAKAYAEYDACEYVRHPNCSMMLHNVLHSKKLEDIFAYANNVFEQCVEVPDRVEIKRIMRKYSPICSQMTGSGPTVFGVYENFEDAKKCAEELSELVESAFVCEPVNSGLEF